MKVRVTFEFNERDRRAINNTFGKPGLASRQDIEAWIRMCVDPTLDDLHSELNAEEEES